MVTVTETNRGRARAAYLPAPRTWSPRSWSEQAAIAPARDSSSRAATPTTARGLSASDSHRPAWARVYPRLRAVGVVLGLRNAPAVEVLLRPTLLVLLGHARGGGARIGRVGVARSRYVPRGAGEPIPAASRRVAPDRPQTSRTTRRPPAPSRDARPRHSHVVSLPHLQDRSATT